VTACFQPWIAKSRSSIGLNVLRGFLDLAQVSAMSLAHGQAIAAGRHDQRQDQFHLKGGFGAQVLAALFPALEEIIKIRAMGGGTREPPGVSRSVKQLVILPAERIEGAAGLWTKR